MIKESRTLVLKLVIADATSLTDYYHNYPEDVTTMAATITTTSNWTLGTAIDTCPDSQTANKSLLYCSLRVLRYYWNCC